MKPPRRERPNRVPFPIGGTTRAPGPHLERLPIAFDLTGISLAEGLRAALASGAVLLLSVWLKSPALLIAAFAANLTCFCDSGGLVGTRVRALFSFTLLGAVAWAGFGLLRNFDWPLAVPVAALMIFLCSMARVWGAAAQAVGNVLIVTIALALDEPLGWAAAGVLGVSFVAGGLWSVLLTLVIWRVHPTRPVAQAVDHVWRALAALARDLEGLVEATPTEAIWDAHNRSHRRATRAAIEDARDLLARGARSKGPLSPSLRRVAIRLEAAEQVFSAMIALSEMLEASGAPGEGQHRQTLRRLGPLLALCAQDRFSDWDRFDPVLTRIVSRERNSDVAPLVTEIGEAMRVALRAGAPDQPYDGRPDQPNEAVRLADAAWRPFRNNLTWQSAILRHATRATVLTVPAILWSLLQPSPYSHWLTITVALTMQPYFAATWQRVLERVGGTLLGGLIGAAAAFLPPDPLVKAVLLVPLCVVGFSVRQVSYGAYIACLTPLVVVLFDVAVPGHSDTTIAAMRFTFTLAGGLLALAACTLLWPTWEPERLAGEIRQALAAHARYAAALFGLEPTERAGVDRLRRLAGVSTNNLEASISRSLQEPGRGGARVKAGLVADAALRRLAGTLVALQHLQDTAPAQPFAPSPWHGWLVAALDALSRRDLPAAPPDMRSTGPTGRLRRAVEVLEAALGTASERG